MVDIRTETSGYVRRRIFDGLAPLVFKKVPCQPVEILVTCFSSKKYFVIAQIFLLSTKQTANFVPRAFFDSLLSVMNSLTKLLPSFASAITTKSARPILAACIHNSAITRQAAATSDQSPAWTPQSQRVGIIARKKGMSTFWDEWGARMPTTVLQVLYTITMSL
jgi:hypothetical protein